MQNDYNILYEIKQLDITICQAIFESNRENTLTRHPSPQQMRIIKYLLKHKDDNIYQKDIQEHLNVSKAAISDTLQSMEKKDMIKRVPSKIDGRKIKIVLTNNGIDTFNEIDKDMKVINEKIQEGISREELDDFIKIINKMKDNIKKVE